MTKAELTQRVFLNPDNDPPGIGFCGCGDPEAALETLRTVLQAFETKDDDERLRVLEAILGPAGSGVYGTYLYWLDSLGLMEHGSNARMGWLTPEGEDLLAALLEHGTDAESWKEWR